MLSISISVIFALPAQFALAIVFKKEKKNVNYLFFIVFVCNQEFTFCLILCICKHICPNWVLNVSHRLSRIIFSQENPCKMFYFLLLFFLAGFFSVFFSTSFLLWGSDQLHLFFFVFRIYYIIWVS